MTTEEAEVLTGGDYVWANKDSKQFKKNEKFIVGERIDETSWKAKSKERDVVLYIDAKHFEIRPVLT